MHKSLDDREDYLLGSYICSCPCACKIIVTTFSRSKKDRLTIFDEFDFRPDRTTDYGVSCPRVSENDSID